MIQYLAAIATSESPSSRLKSQDFANLSQQILQANPILEAFGNAQTVRNNNSSRFGKFIRIEFSRAGQIAGAFIDWYLLEKSRVVKLNGGERNYHVFYQLLAGANQSLRTKFLLDGFGLDDFAYTKSGNHEILGVSDKEEWISLIEAFNVMGFSENEQESVLRTVAAILFLGNITVAKESSRADQAVLSPDAYEHAEKACSLLGVSRKSFIEGLLHPKVKAGRETVERVQTPEQVRSALDALSKGIYERGFGDLVNRINRQLDGSKTAVDESYFIGVLDIAGFEIFEENSFEQLCINYTNEKLQQFFNHHMFVLEQEEYAREQIEWQFIDFGKDLQPTIDLIELPNPIGIFSCLDEDSVMPKATDRTFTEKMHSLWDRKSSKYRPSRLSQGFLLTHYAAEVEYSTDGWLEKNKDPLNDNLTRLLARSENRHTARLFADCLEPEDENGQGRSRVKKGLFRTVAQRHKEQLSSLMNQLHSTHPHFVRCILPNHKKRPKQFITPLVLDQLRCNGVLEGIRIARTGFPNRLPFAEFRSRYEVLCRNFPRGNVEGQSTAMMILERLCLDKAWYRVGLTKVFFRAGVLAELEDQRDALIRDIMSRFQSVSKGYIQRKIAHKRLYRVEATRIIQRNFHVYMDLCNNPWWKLMVRMRPLLGATRTSGEVKKRDEMIQKLESKLQQDIRSRHHAEEERRKADAEISQIRQTLESERSLALDKEEIFRRLQDRESELSEKLAGAIEDQEHLEDQLDDMMDAKKRAEEQCDVWRQRMEQASHIISKLETEKAELIDQVSKLDQRINEVEGSKADSRTLHEKLDQENRILQSQLHLQERKMSEIEAKAVRNDQELEIKLMSTSKDRQKSHLQVKELLSDNSQIRQQLSQLSSTSTSYEDVIRRKDSEIALLKNDQARFDGELKSLLSEKANFETRYAKIQARLRQVQADSDAATTQRSTLEREVADAKRILDAKLSEDVQASTTRRTLEGQMTDLKSQLYQAQEELSRERQSRDDVQMLGEHKIATMKEDFNNLNESKITIEKELYVQQDTLRRATEARATAEKGRRELQSEMKKLRERFLELEASRMETEATIDKNAIKQSSERQAELRRELEDSSQRLDESGRERERLGAEVTRLRSAIVDSENFSLHHDQDKQRLERELVTVKGRLMASENDNKALLNKVQQKNLDIARSSSRVNEASRSQMTRLQADKHRLEQENKAINMQCGEAQVLITSLERQKERLCLDLEDLRHENTREHQSSRSAEKTSSTLSAQLAEARRLVENEQQLKQQAQANTRKVQECLDNSNREMQEIRNHVTLLHKLFNPQPTTTRPTWESIRPHLRQYTDLAAQLDASQQSLRVMSEKCNRAETQLLELRRQYNIEIDEMDTRHSTSKRQLLEEMSQNAQNTLSTRKSPKYNRKGSDYKLYSNPATPDRRHISNTTHDSGVSDRTVDSIGYSKRMDLAAELESVQNQLQMAEMQNRHLQSQLGRASPLKDRWQEDSPSLRRVQKLEKENHRLNEKLDDSAKKVSNLERSLHSGELSLRDVQAQSHEELYKLINSQEHARKSLLQDHTSVVADLAEAKSHLDNVKHKKASTEVELRDVHSELRDLSAAHEQEAASRSQILQEQADLQIRLDAESSRLSDAEADVLTYKRRADEYFSKLEQAEIAVLKANRAEQFAKQKAQDTEDACASIMSEREQVNAQLDDLQRQSQQYEEKIEDLSADLQSALQAKKRLANDLEDYRNQRAIDIEDKETSMEQTRKKYKGQFASLTNELEIERENVLHAKSENAKLRVNICFWWSSLLANQHQDDLEELRSKWDDEVINSSTWAKEKARLEQNLIDVASSREEAVAAHNDAQSKVVALLSQVRELRSSVDDASVERDQVQKEKRSLEGRLTEANNRLEDLARSDSPSMRNAAGVDREVLDLKAAIAQKEDIAAAAIDKMRRTDALMTEMQKDINSGRETSHALHKEKAGLEKTIKDLQGRVVELETKDYSSGSQDIRFLNSRVQELEHQLEAQAQEHTSSLRSVRMVDRTVKDLNAQIQRRDKQVQSLNDEISKGRDKIERLLQDIDELQAEEAKNQLAAKRAERDLREEKEKALKLERELGGWKALRMERSSSRIATAGGNVSDWGSVRGGMEGRRDSGLHRVNTNTKGFL